MSYWNHPIDSTESERQSQIRRGAAPEAKAWFDRAMVDLHFHGKASGVAESCPSCWRPIVLAPISNITGRESCGCGTRPLHDLGGRVRTHGLGSIVDQFAPNAPGMRSD